MQPMNNGQIAMLATIATILTGAVAFYELAQPLLASDPPPFSSIARSETLKTLIRDTDNATNARIVRGQILAAERDRCQAIRNKDTRSSDLIVNTIDILEADYMQLTGLNLGLSVC
jgi:hypothetical protein